MRYIREMCVAAAVAISTPALAQPTLYFAGYDGEYQTLFQKEIIPAFEAAHGVKVVYVAGNSSATVAKLQAQKGRQEINVAMVDDGPMQQAVQFGFCEKLADAPVFHRVYDVASPAVFAGRAVGVGLVATGIAYNTSTFEKNHWAPPRSWNDLTDAKFAQRVASNPISGTYGLAMLVMYARLNGGGERNIEPGIEAVRTRLKKNILSWTTSNAQIADLFQTGDIDLAVWGSTRVAALRSTGFPVQFVYPAEGAPAIVAATCVVADNKLPEQSQAFIQYLASPEIQVKLASLGFGPTNRDTVLAPAVAAGLPYGQDIVSKLVKLDWAAINQQRSAWTTEWNRTVER